MKFFQIVIPLLALCVGLIVWQETSSPTKTAQAPANSPADDSASPSAGNLLNGLGIALGGTGSMNAAGGSDDPRLVTDPNKTRREAFYGWDVRHPGMTGPDDSIHLVQSAMAGVPMRPNPEYPASLRTISPDANCAAPPVGANQRLTKVHVFDGGKVESGYHAVSNQMLAEGAKDYLRDLQQAKDPAMERPPSTTRAVPVVNVVLADESAPLYLVLQSSSKPILWNLHATAGVEVAQIVLVGNPGQAVHPLRSATPVTALAMSGHCAPQPWRDVAVHWQKHPNALAGSRTETGGTYTEQAKGYYDRYNAWFQTTFGATAEPGTVGAWTATHVLVGPMPASAEARAVYRPLTGGEIVVHEGPLLYISSEGERRRDVASRRHALALAAAGGDLSILNPAPVERAQ